MSDLNEPKKETVRITLPPRAPVKEVGAASDNARINLPGRSPTSGDAPPMARPPIPDASSTPVARPPMARPPIPSASSGTAVRPPSFAPPKPPVPTAGPAPVAPKPGGAAPAPPAMPPRPKILPPPPRVIPPSAAPAPSSAVTDAPSNYPGSATQSGPRKETARISILPEPAASPATVKMAKTQPLLAVPATQVHSAPVNVANVPAGSSGSFLDRLDEVPLAVCWIIFGISGLTMIIQIWNYLSA